MRSNDAYETERAAECGDCCSGETAAEDSSEAYPVYRCSSHGGELISKKDDIQTFDVAYS